jgi:hypothetical protein
MSQQTYINTKCNIAPGVNANFASTSCDWGIGGLTQDKPFPSVQIIGGGIAGLTVAYELVRAYHQQQGKKIGDTIDLSNFDVTINEKQPYLGGKIVGYFNKDNNPVEHSTRVYGVGYVGLFDIINNIPSINQSGNSYNIPNDLGGARSVLDDLTPMYINYVNGITYEPNYTNIPGTTAYTQFTGLIKLLKDAGITNSEITFVLKKFQTFFEADYPGRLDLTAGYSIGQYLEYPKLSNRAQQILNSYIGIIVAARVQCDAYAIMTLFEGLGMFGAPKTSQAIKDSGISGLNMFPGPSSIYFIEPMVRFLEKNGVKINLGKTISPTDYQNMLTDDNINVVVLSTPHMVTANYLGPTVFPSTILHNEWSWGIQYYVTDLSTIEKIIPKRDEQNIYNCVLGSPWQIIYVIEYSQSGTKALKDKYGYETFWGKNDMGSNSQKQPILATITVTSSNQYMAGVKVGKSALYCTPLEMLEEVLIQVGVRDENSVKNILLNTPSFGSITYVKKEEGDKKGPEYLKGPVQSNGYQWISDYTLYIAMPNNPTYGSKGMCNINNMSENPGCTNMNELPGRVAGAVDNALLHYMGIATKSEKENKNPISGNSTEYVYNIPSVFDNVPDQVYLAGEYTNTPNLQIPTMEKACESGKLAARKIIMDFGIASLERQKDFADGKLKIDGESGETNFMSASVLVQVTGLKKPTELIPFIDISTLDKLQIALYTGWQIGYPAWVKPITMIFILMVVALIVVLLRKIRKKHKKN